VMLLGEFGVDGLDPFLARELLARQAGESRRERSAAQRRGLALFRFHFLLVGSFVPSGAGSSGVSTMAGSWLLANWRDSAHQAMAWSRGA
jgi:hypothetical protein